MSGSIMSADCRSEGCLRPPGFAHEREHDCHGLIAIHRIDAAAVDCELIGAQSGVARWTEKPPTLEPEPKTGVAWSTMTRPRSAAEDDPTAWRTPAVPGVDTGDRLRR